MASKTHGIGTLNDSEIIEYCKKSELISDYFSEKQVHQACYELRSGTVFYDLTEDTQAITLKEGEDILIKPKHMVVIITLEELKLPNDILGRILTKGSFFSLGLTPVNTYADPGFQGNLGIVLFNSSFNYIRIPTAMSIAKIEFNRLKHPVENPYSGQHGYRTSIWPIRKELILSKKQIKNDYRIGDPFQELIIQHGDLFGKIVKRIFGYERWILMVSTVLLIINVVVIWFLQGSKIQLSLSSFILGVLSNLFVFIVVTFVTNLRGK